MATNEAFSRVQIDAQLKDQGWNVLDTHAVRFEYLLPDKTKADYVLCDRHGRALAVIEAKRACINPAEAEAQAKGYAEQLKAPYIFLSNGEEIRFWEWQREAFPRPVKTFFAQGDLERRAGRRFQDEKRITITTLQSMVNIHSSRCAGAARARPRARASRSSQYLIPSTFVDSLGSFTAPKGKVRHECVLH